MRAVGSALVATFFIMCSGVANAARCDTPTDRVAYHPPLGGVLRHRSSAVIRIAPHIHCAPSRLSMRHLHNNLVIDSDVAGWYHVWDIDFPKDRPDTENSGWVRKKDLRITGTLGPIFPASSVPVH